MGHSDVTNDVDATPGVLHHTERELRAAFLSEVERIPGGERLERCIQCGTCTGSCPVSYAMDVSPRQVIALFRAGAIEQILQSRTVWVCASCYNCTVRCPAQIRITDLFYALKRLAMERGIRPSRFPVYRLSECFARSVRRYGRNYEFGLIRSFLMATRPWVLLRQSAIGWRLWRRGRLSLLPESIRGRNDLRAIIDRAQEIERPQEAAPDERLSADEVGYGTLELATGR